MGPKKLFFKLDNNNKAAPLSRLRKNILNTDTSFIFVSEDPRFKGDFI